MRSGEPLYEPLYTMEHAMAAIKLLHPCDYEQRITLCDGIDIRFTDVGHLLGSAAIEIWITEEGDLEYDETDLAGLTTADITEALTEKAKSLYAAKEEEFGSEVMRELERVVLLKVVDTKWMAHIDDMDELKKGIGLRAYGQQNPVVESRYEGFEMFDAMVDSIREDTVRMLLTVRLQKNQAPEREQVSKPDAPNAGAGDGSFGGQRRSAKKK